MSYTVQLHKYSNSEILKYSNSDWRFKKSATAYSDTHTHSIHSFIAIVTLIYNL